MAQRQRFQVQKSRLRDPRALGWGLYRVVDPNTNIVVAGGQPWDHSLTLDDVEAYLTYDEAAWANALVEHAKKGTLPAHLDRIETAANELEKSRKEGKRA
jgi:hypothetical protein